MNIRLTIVALLGALLTSIPGAAQAPQPSYINPFVSEIIDDPAERRAAYLARLDEVKKWRIDRIGTGNPKIQIDIASASLLLLRGEKIDEVNARIIELMKDPGTGPFGCFPPRLRLTPDGTFFLRKPVRPSATLGSAPDNCVAIPKTIGRCITPPCI